MSEDGAGDVLATIFALLTYTYWLAAFVGLPVLVILNKVGVL